MYSVLERILQTDEGKVIVRSHNANRNAQSIYAEFLQVMTQSTEAMMDSGELLAYLTTAKISDGSWRGTTKTFVLNWIDKLRLYHELTPVADRLSENTQRTLLQNAVIGLNTLRQVQINSNLKQATHGTALMFAQKCTLLINLATGYDKQKAQF
jgi:ABC-type enterochelin transport system ATPase subunit